MQQSPDQEEPTTTTGGTLLPSTAVTTIASRRRLGILVIIICMVVSNMEHFSGSTMTLQQTLSSQAEKSASTLTSASTSIGKRSNNVTSVTPQTPPETVAAMEEAGESATSTTKVVQVLPDDAPSSSNNQNKNETLAVAEGAGTSSVSTTKVVQVLHDVPSPSPAPPSLVLHDDNNKNDTHGNREDNDEDSNNNNKNNANKKQNPFQRIILMGQFNYPKVEIDVLRRWINKFTPIFGKVIIRGEFWNSTRINEIRTAIPNIDIQLSDNTFTKPNKYGKYTGFFTPMSNLKHALLDYQNLTDVFDGILYMHDDSIPNLQVLAGVQQQQDDNFDNDGNQYNSGYYHRDIGGNLQSEHVRNYGIVGTTLGTMNTIKHNDYSYINPREVVPLHKDMIGNEKEYHELHGKFSYLSRKSYRIYASTQLPFATIDGTYQTQTMQELHKNKLDNWNQRTLGDRCMGGQYNMIQSISKNRTLFDKYFEYDNDDDNDNGTDGGSNNNNYDKNNTNDFKNTNNPYMIFAAHTQADLLYMPFTYTSTFVELATLLEMYQVWIECAIPTIVDQIQRLHSNGASTTNTNETSSSSRNINNKGGVPVNVIPLCTSWKGSRGKPYMALVCVNATNPYYHGVYHPIKPGVDIDGWENVFDIVNDKYLQSIVNTIE